MTWHWSASPPPGVGFVEAGGQTRFPSQAEAEAWLAQVWPELVEAGVREVSLHEGDRLVYGPMSLEAG